MFTNNSLIAGIILVLLTSGITVYGQETASPSKGKLAAGYFATGAGMISESGRNSVVYSVGGGGHSLTNRWILGGEGHSSFGPDNAGGYGFFNIGYAVVSTNTIVFYPFLGLGGVQ